MTQRIFTGLAAGDRDGQQFAAESHHKFLRAGCSRDDICLTSEFFITEVPNCSRDAVAEAVDMVD
jgi:hypothetical protein